MKENIARTSSPFLVFGALIARADDCNFISKVNENIGHFCCKMNGQIGRNCIDKAPLKNCSFEGQPGFERQCDLVSIIDLDPTKILKEMKNSLQSNGCTLAESSTQAIRSSFVPYSFQMVYDEEVLNYVTEQKIKVEVNLLYNRMTFSPNSEEESSQILKLVGGLHEE